MQVSTNVASTDQSRLRLDGLGTALGGATPKMVGIRVLAASILVLALLVKGQFVSALLLSVVIAVLQALFGSEEVQAPTA